MHTRIRRTISVLLFLAMILAYNSQIAINYKYNQITIQGLEDTDEAKTDWIEDVVCFVFDFDNNQNIAMINDSVLHVYKVLKTEQRDEPKGTLYFVKSDGLEMTIIAPIDLSIVIILVNGYSWVFSNTKF